MAAILQVFSNAFYWVEKFLFGSDFTKGLFDNMPALVYVKTWRRPPDNKPLPEPIAQSTESESL